MANPIIVNRKKDIPQLICNTLPESLSIVDEICVVTQTPNSVVISKKYYVTIGEEQKVWDAELVEEYYILPTNGIKIQH